MLDMLLPYKNEYDTVYSGRLTKMLFCKNIVQLNKEIPYKLWFNVPYDEESIILINLFFKFIKLYNIKNESWDYYKFFFDIIPPNPLNFIIYLYDEITNQDIIDLINLLYKLNIYIPKYDIYIGLLYDTGDKNKLVSIPYNIVLNDELESYINEIDAIKIINDIIASKYIVE